MCSRMPSVSWVPISSTGFSDVMGSWKIMEMSLPRICCISFSGRVTRSRPSKMISPSTILPGGSGIRRMMDIALDALAATALPHDPEGLALVQRVADAVDRVDHAFPREEVRLEVADLEEGGHLVSLVRGSIASRKPSPTKLKASTVTAMKSPGRMINQG